MNKRLFLAVPAALGVFALAACGSSGSSGNAAAPQTSNTTTGAATSAPQTSSSAAPGKGATGGSTALPTSPGSVTIGSADFPENELLMDIYGDAMSAKGVKVSKKPNIGERGVYMAAMSDGSIGAIPEYSGSILSYLEGSSASQTSPNAVYAALQKAAASKGFVALKYAAAQDSDTITVTKDTADKYHLKTIADLKPVAGQLTLGAPAQFRTRPDGIPALKKIYGITFGTFTPLTAQGISTATALKSGAIDAADIFSTDPSVVQNGFVPLVDNKHMFAAQNIVPLFSQKVLTQPMKTACDAVSAKLDTKTLAQLVARVAGGADADQVAKSWLKQEHLG